MDLHGNSLLKETTPEGNIDQNVFDIQQGVAILIAVREKDHSDYGSTTYKSRDGVKEMAKVLYYDLWGRREDKYNFLESASLHNIDWIEVKPTEPNYFFAPKDFDLATEYNQGCLISDIFIINSSGFTTHRDNFAIDFDRDVIKKRIRDLISEDLSNDYLQELYSIHDSRDWNLAEARKQVRKNLNWENDLISCLYRPFDKRFCYLSTVAMDFPRPPLKQHLIQDNLSLLCNRQLSIMGWRHIFVTNSVPEICSISSASRERTYVFPLYTYPNTENKQTNLFLEKTPNLSPKFLETIKEKLGKIPTPEQIFYYAYAIFHSPTYRTRYAEFLKIDFPRLPLTSNQNLFNSLAIKGEELVNLHLMKSDTLNNLMTTYQQIGDNQITEVTYNVELQRVYSTFLFKVPHLNSQKVYGTRVIGFRFVPDS